MNTPTAWKILIRQARNNLITYFVIQKTPRKEKRVAKLPTWEQVQNYLQENHIYAYERVKEVRR